MANYSNMKHTDEKFILIGYCIRQKRWNVKITPTIGQTSMARVNGRVKVTIDGPPRSAVI